MTDSTTDTPGWWAELYDRWIAEALLMRHTQAEVDETLDFLVGSLKLTSGDRVFDQCCGIGSLSNPLAARGMIVLGVDQADGYIRTARASAEAGATFETGDCFEYRATPRCNAVVNWWTSYGYGDDAQNQSMLTRAWESLLPGGRLALDTMNVPGVIRHFRRDVTLRRMTDGGELLLLRRSELDLVAGRLLKQWTILPPDGSRLERHSSVRLTMPDAIDAQLRAAGFDDIQFYGDIHQSPLTADSPRCIVVARRPVEIP